MATSPELRKTVLIGLGGAGQLILMDVKRLFLDTYGVLPPSIKLLAMDTDSTRMSLRSATSEREYTFDPQEFLHLQVAQPRLFIEAGDVVKRWYVQPVPVGAISNGAGAVRQNGRLSLFFHINEFLRRIDGTVQELRHPQLSAKMMNARAEMNAFTDFQLSEKDPEVYVCGSLAGGTGSGTFIDAGILLRHKMPNALIHGFFLLNWIYRNKAFAHRVRGNVYAALAELDNLQSIMYGSQGHVPYTMRYADEQVEVRECPYSLFHLIDGRNEYGENIYNLEHLCETVANAMFLSIGSMGYRIASVVDNLLAHINVQNPRVWRGRYARYSSLGVSSIYYPARELHRLISLQAALGLCRAAVAEVNGELSDPDRQAERARRIQQDLDALTVQLKLDRASIRDGTFPFRADITFQVEKFELADPELLKSRQETEEKALEALLQHTFRPDFIDGLLEKVRQKLDNLDEDPALDTAYRRLWIDQAIERFTAWSNDAAGDASKARDQVNQSRESARNQMELLSQSWFIPIVGGPRKSAADKWSGTILELLSAIKDAAAFEDENRAYQAVLKMLKQRRPASVATPSEISTAPVETERALRRLVANEHENLKRLKSKPTQTLIGGGDTIFVPEDLWQAFGVPPVKRHTIPLYDVLNYALDYTAFKTDKGIHTAEDYLRIYQRSPKELAALFVDYCLEKLAGLKGVSVQQAMDAVGTGSGDKDAYVKARFDDLFRMSSALWSFSRGRMNEVQSLQYDKIINIGVHDQEEGAANYDTLVQDVKSKYKIRADHAFSTTHDPYRIWLLNYAAALPLYFLSDLERSKERYEEEITPTYHIDSYFEMNVPDLFPMSAEDNIALRVLGMAIVPGIDVIHDEKLTKGHKFTCDAEPVKALNFNEPKIWFLFRDMYSEVKDNYAPRGGNSLLDILTSLLKEKVRSMPQAELRRCIEAYIQKVREKLDRRGFSRLISARLTYREIKELQDFLAAPHRGGYGMDIERYIAGR